MQEVIKSLEILLDPYDWFHEIGVEDNRYIVYVSYMDQSQDSIIPDRAPDGKQILCHFVSSMTVAKDKFLDLTSPTMENVLVDECEFLSKSDVDDLEQFQKELGELQKICGSHTLQEIFFEIKDQENAVTNMTIRFPEVRKELEKLY